MTQTTFDYVPDEPEKKPRQNTGNHPHPGPDTAEQVATPKAAPAATALAVIEIKKETALTAFTGEKGLDPYLDELERRARAAIAGYDITTIAGQDGIRSVAYSLSKSKKPLENMAAELKKDANDLIDKVNAERDRGIDKIDAIQKELRRPLTEYEEKEKVRIAAHKDRLAALENLAVFISDGEVTSGTVQARIDRLAADFKDIAWQEFTEPAKAARERVEATLADKLVKANKAESDAAELARLRAAEDARKQKERDDKIAADAAAVERTWVEAHAENDRLDAARAAKEAEEKARREAAFDLAWSEGHAENARLDAQREKDAADRRAQIVENGRIAAYTAAAEKMSDMIKLPEGYTAAVLQSRIDTLRVIYNRDWQEYAAAAETSFKDTEKALVAIHGAAVKKEAEAKRIADQAIADAAAQKEKDRVAAEKKVQKDADDKRAADTAHKAKVNRAALEAIADILEKVGPSSASDEATAIVEAIASGKIPHTSIKY